MTIPLIILGVDGVQGHHMINNSPSVYITTPILSLIDYPCYPGYGLVGVDVTFSS